MIAFQGLAMPPRNQWLGTLVLKQLCARQVFSPESNIHGVKTASGQETECNIGGDAGQSCVRAPMPNAQTREKRGGNSRWERREEKTREGVTQEGFGWNLACRHAQIRGDASDPCSLC